jgi:hypothetical protein
MALNRADSGLVSTVFVNLWDLHVSADLLFTVSHHFNVQLYKKHKVVVAVITRAPHHEGVYVSECKLQALDRWR